MSTTTGHHTHSTHNAHSTPQSTLHTYTRINGTILLASTISHSNRITRVQEDERLFESIYYFFLQSGHKRSSAVGWTACVFVCCHFIRSDRRKLRSPCVHYMSHRCLIGTTSMSSYKKMCITKHTQYNYVYYISNRTIAKWQKYHTCNTEVHQIRLNGSNYYTTMSETMWMFEQFVNFLPFHNVTKNSSFLLLFWLLLLIQPFE